MKRVISKKNMFETFLIFLLILIVIFNNYKYATLLKHVIIVLPIFFLLMFSRKSAIAISSPFLIYGAIWCSTFILSTLAAIPVTIDIDLRAPEEVKQAPDKLPQTASYYHLPVFKSDETDASHSDEEIMSRILKPGNGYQHMLDVYRRMVEVPTAKAAYQRMFELLLSNNPTQASLFHCTAGKDRTGMAAYLILSALQVPEETILKDYLLTNKATQSFREQWLQMLRDKGENEVVVENRRALGSVSVDYLNQTIDLINTNYGNVQNYLTEYFDLSPTDLKQLQQLYLD